MARVAGTERQRWRDRLDRSDWIDGTPWVEDGPDEDEPGVEFLGTEPSAYRLTPPERIESSPSTGSPWTKIAGLAAVGVVLIALAIMSRPGEADPFDQLSPAEQQAILERRAGGADQVVPSTTTAPVLDGGSTTAAATATTERPLQPIPPLRDELPDDLPGIVYGFGADGSVVRIERGVDTPTETVLDLTTAEKRRALAAGLGPDFLVVGGDVLHRFDPSGASSVHPFEGDDVLPADEGRVVVVTRRPATQEVRLATVDAAGVVAGFDAPADDASTVPTWSLFDDVAVLGAWGDRLVVSKVGGVWLLDTDGRSTPITDGLALGYDGRHLATLRCQSPADCWIRVGTPAQPSQRAIPVPDELGRQAVGAWADSVTVSPDGRRLAFTVDRGAVAFPGWVDMDDGTEFGLAAGMNHSSPLAWSPDGAWLAYVFIDDLIVVDAESGRSHRITLDRQLSYLSWTDRPDQG